MKIKIVENADGLFRSFITTGGEVNNPKWEKKLKYLSGKVLEVETDYLFKDQFNTAPVPVVSDSGLRIMSRYVKEVIDDERITRMRCQYCGHNDEVGMTCSKCGKDNYLEPLSKEAEISLDYMKRAKAEREAGGSIDVHAGGLYVAITMSDKSEYFFQGEEADNLEKEYKEFDWMSCSFEDYLLAVAQNW
jgi:DNA-directed RNA polymerase subunit RPC12/RpoP